MELGLWFAWWLLAVLVVVTPDVEPPLEPLRCPEGTERLPDFHYPVQFSSIDNRTTAYVQGIQCLHLVTEDA